jgi:hypothetical protein
MDEVNKINAREQLMDLKLDNGIYFLQTGLEDGSMVVRKLVVKKL